MLPKKREDKLFWICCVIVCLLPFGMKLYERLTEPLVPQTDRKTGKTGYANDHGELRINYEWEVCGYKWDEGKAMVQSGENQFGFINRWGKVVVPLKYSGTKPFSDGMAAVKSGGLWGFVNSNGEEVIKPAYRTVGNFSEGYAAVMADGSRFGYINKKGDMVLQPVYDVALPVHDGLAPVMVEAQFFDADEKIDPKYILTPGSRDVLRDGEKDRNKFWTVACSDSHKVDLDYESGIDYRTGKWGYIDIRTGQYKIKPCFEDAFSFSEGVAAVKQGGKYGFINKEAQFVIPPAYFNAKSFQDGVAIITTASQNPESIRYGVIDHKGKELTGMQYSYIDDFLEGVARATLNGKMGFLDCKGKLVIPAKFITGSDFQNGLALVLVAKNQSDYSIINRKGEIVSSP